MSYRAGSRTMLVTFSRSLWITVMYSPMRLQAMIRELSLLSVDIYMLFEIQSMAKPDKFEMSVSSMVSMTPFDRPDDFTSFMMLSDQKSLLSLIRKSITFGLTTCAEWLIVGIVWWLGWRTSTPRISEPMMNRRTCSFGTHVWLSASNRITCGHSHLYEFDVLWKWINII